MRQRPLSLVICALLFLYFPGEFVWRNWGFFDSVDFTDVFFSVLLPLALLFPLIKVTRVGWYTLVAMVALWGVRDLYEYYASRGSSLWPLYVHLGIYGVSLSYFINPRVRHLYFDPKLRWWRAKRRYETHLPFILHQADTYEYPILRNISEGGCFIETPNLRAMNSTLEVVIPLPTPVNVAVIRTMGEVRWISNSPGRPGMGVQFLDTTPANVRALTELVQKRLV